MVGWLVALVFQEKPRCGWNRGSCSFLEPNRSNNTRRDSSEMALTDYTVGGRRVPLSDLVVAFTVSSPIKEIVDAFVTDNASRICEAEPVKDENTLEPLGPTVVLTFSNLPSRSYSHFSLGRDSGSCEVVVPANPAVRRTHLKFVFEGDDIVLYDVSSFGTELIFGEDKKPQKTSPAPGAPLKSSLPHECKITLAIPGIKFHFTLAYREAACAPSSGKTSSTTFPVGTKSLVIPSAASRAAHKTAVSPLHQPLPYTIDGIQPLHNPPGALVIPPRRTVSVPITGLSIARGTGSVCALRGALLVDTQCC